MKALWCIAAACLLAVVAGNLVLYAWRVRMLGRAAECNLLEPLGLVHALWAFVKECAASALVLLLIPVGWLLPRCRKGGGTRGPIILLHGLGVNRGAFWLLGRRLRRDGWSPVWCFDSGLFTTDIEAAAAQLRAVVDRVASTSDTQAPLLVIGHGVGGLVLRYFLRRYPAARVRRVITLGTPHHGTAVARLLGPAGRSLLPHSAFLRRLNAADRVPEQFDVIALHSTFDATILPLEYALYPGAFNAQFNDVGHFSFLFSSRAYRVIAENLAAPLR